MPTPRRRQKPNSIMVLVMDHDRKIFSVHGPMNDDRQLQDRVLAAQKVGRDVNCSSDRLLTRDQMISGYTKEYGYQHVASVELPALSFD